MGRNETASPVSCMFRKKLQQAGGNCLLSLLVCVPHKYAHGGPGTSDSGSTGRPGVTGVCIDLTMAAPYMLQGTAFKIFKTASYPQHDHHHDGGKHGQHEPDRAARPFPPAASVPPKAKSTQLAHAVSADTAVRQLKMWLWDMSCSWRTNGGMCSI